LFLLVQITDEKQPFCDLRQELSFVDLDQERLLLRHNADTILKLSSAESDVLNREDWKESPLLRDQLSAEVGRGGIMKAGSVR
jgi:hypothetical protein